MLSFSHLIISPYPRIQFCFIVTNVALLFVEAKERVSPFNRDFLLVSKMTCLCSREERDWNSCVLSREQTMVSPFSHPSIHQLSSLEKTPILSTSLVRVFNELFVIIVDAVLGSLPITGCFVLSYFSAFALQGF